MTQQINLYQPERYAKRVPISAHSMALVVAAVFFLAAAAGAVDYWRTANLGSELGRLQELRNTAVQRIDDYQHRYPPRSADPELVRRVATMTHEREADLALLRLLTDGQIGNNRGLSEHLAGLARQDLSTVWLRRIRFSVGGERLLLEGSCTRAADIPLFLQRLSKQPVFAGREFEHLELSRSENTTSIIDFLLQTTPQETP
jgi:hypothetical protein